MAASSSGNPSICSMDAVAAAVRDVTNVWSSEVVRSLLRANWMSSRLRSAIVGTRSAGHDCPVVCNSFVLVDTSIVAVDSRYSNPYLLAAHRKNEGHIPEYLSLLSRVGGSHINSDGPAQVEGNLESNGHTNIQFVSNL